MTAQQPQPMIAFRQCTRKPAETTLATHQSLGVQTLLVACVTVGTCSWTSPGNRCGPAPPPAPRVQPGGLAPAKSKMHVLVWPTRAWSVGTGAPSPHMHLN